jgi:response regulator RpfG family c-di-GMP phosphodiesterase
MENGGHILIVDDEAQIRRLIRRILERCGYRTDEVENGRQALEFLQSEPVDLVVTDLRMPDVDGLELLERCRALYPNTDVIMLTGFGTIQTAVYAMRQGALDYMTKPFSAAELQDKVAHCFRQRQRRAAQRSPIEPLLELNRILSRPIDPSKISQAVIRLIERTFAPVHTQLTLFGSGRVGRRGREDGAFLPDRPEGAIVDVAGDEVDTAAGGPVLTVPLRVGDEEVGVLTLLRRRNEPPFSPEDSRLLHLFAGQIALVFLHADTRQRLWDAFRDLERAYLSPVQTLIDALGLHDAYTRDHSQRVAHYARLLGQRCGLPDDDVERLGIAGLLHDVGKFGIGDGTLRKAGSLTHDELDHVRRHPVMGVRILEGIDALHDIVPMVRHHHERYDGKGYPDGLAGEDIPLGARILAVVDAYDSMTSDRSYRPALSVKEATKRLLAGAGSQLDGRLVTEWIAVMDKGSAELEIAGSAEEGRALHE